VRNSSLLLKPFGKRIYHVDELIKELVEECERELERKGLCFGGE